MAVAEAAALYDAGKYTERPWTCTDFDERECRQKILSNLQEQYNTIYACTFLPPPASAAAAQHSAHAASEGWLLAAYRSGVVRLFNWRRVCSTWLAGQQAGAGAQREQLSWRAHSGPVYALAVLEHDGLQWLATAGGDGRARLWSVAAVLQAAGGAAAVAAAGGGNDAGSVEEELQPWAEVLLPHLQNPLGLSDGGQPAAQALAVDPRQQQLFIGGSDGGVHAWRLSQLAAAAAALAGLKQPASAAGALALVGMPGHAAAVLGLDFCAATNKLASASEDGTVRVWDAASLECCLAIDPWQETVLLRSPGGGGPTAPAPAPAVHELLACARSPACLCVAWDECGNWLLVGHADGSLTLWNCMTGSAARHKDLAGSSSSSSTGAGSAKAVPQVLLVSPGLTLAAGTGGKLLRLGFNLEQQTALEVSPESVFGLALDHSGSGMLAVCGSRGRLDLLSLQGQALGRVGPPPSVLMPPSSRAASAAVEGG